MKLQQKRKLMWCSACDVGGTTMTKEQEEDESGRSNHAGFNLEGEEKKEQWIRWCDDACGQSHGHSEQAPVALLGGCLQ